MEDVVAISGPEFGEYGLDDPADGDFWARLGMATTTTERMQIAA
jgi:hypothetical protein